jgi:hypothetical protein
MQLPDAGAPDAALSRTPEMIPAEGDPGAAMPDVAMAAPTGPNIIYAPTAVTAFTAPVRNKRKQDDQFECNRGSVAGGAVRALPASRGFAALTAVRALQASQMQVWSHEFQNQMAQQLRIIECAIENQASQLFDTEAKLESIRDETNKIQKKFDLAMEEMRKKLELSEESEQKAKQQYTVMKEMWKLVDDREKSIEIAMGPGVKQLSADKLDIAVTGLQAQLQKTVENAVKIDKYMKEIGEEKVFRQGLERLANEPNTEHYFCPISGKPMHYPVVVEYAANEPGTSESSNPSPRHSALQSYNVCEIRRLQSESEDGVFIEPDTGRRCVGFFCNTALMNGLRTLVRDIQHRRTKQIAVMRDTGTASRE